MNPSTISPIVLNGHIISLNSAGVVSTVDAKASPGDFGGFHFAPNHDAVTPHPNTKKFGEALAPVAHLMIPHILRDRSDHDLSYGWPP